MVNSLNAEEARNLLLTRPHQRELSQARVWQNRVRFHGLIVRDKQASAHYSRFRAWAFALLTATDKRDAFDALMSFPLPTNRLAAEVQDSWMRIHDAVNPRFEITARDGVEEDLRQYLGESDEQGFWNGEAISALWESHNDFLVIDLPAEPAPGPPRPYMSRLSLDSMVDCRVGKNGVAHHVAYERADGLFNVLCSGYYRTFSKVEGGYTLITETPHALGYCPARLLWDEQIPGHSVGSASPVDEVLYYLDYYLFWHISTDLFKLFGAFPIMWEIQTEPASPAIYTEPALNADGTPDAGYLGNCYGGPRALETNYIGPGDLRVIPPGMDPKPPVGIVEPSVAALEFQKADRESMYQDILSYLTGAGGESNLMTKALNEKQVSSTFAGKENTLAYISTHLSAAREWVVNTIGALRYSTAFTSATIHFGTEFYLQSETDLWDGLKIARDAGSPQTVLLEKVDAIQTFRHRQQPSGAARSRILLDCEPLPEYSLIDAVALSVAGAVDRKAVQVKAQFTTLIRKLERDLGADIVQIGSGVSYAEKIKRITDYLYSNVTEQEPVGSPGSPGNAQNAGRNTSQAVPNS